MISKKTKYGLKALSFIARSEEKLIPIKTKVHEDKKKEKAVVITF